LRDKKVAFRVDEIINVTKNTEKFSEIDFLKKLVGFKNAYRIRIGNYRIGIVFENDTIIFSAFGDRKEIYKYFP